MYEVVIPASVANQIRKLPRQVSDRILDEIDQLGDEPRPPNCKKLMGEDFSASVSETIVRCTPLTMQTTVLLSYASGIAARFMASSKGFPKWS